MWNCWPSVGVSVPHMWHVMLPSAVPAKRILSLLDSSSCCTRCPGVRMSLRFAQMSKEAYYRVERALLWSKRGLQLLLECL